MRVDPVAGTRHERSGRLRRRRAVGLAGQWTCCLLSLAAAAFWPWSHCYTSFGLDFEHAEAAHVRCVYYRVRWPGDGSVALCREEALRVVDERGVTAWDLGGRFLWPAVPVGAEGFMQRAGFWWIRHGPDRGAAPPIVAGAQSAVLVGVPHWLLVCGLASSALWVVSGRRRVT